VSQSNSILRKILGSQTVLTGAVLGFAVANLVAWRRPETEFATTCLLWMTTGYATGGVLSALFAESFPGNRRLFAGAFGFAALAAGASAIGFAARS